MKKEGCIIEKAIEYMRARKVAMLADMEAMEAMGEDIPIEVLMAKKETLMSDLEILSALGKIVGLDIYALGKTMGVDIKAISAEKKMEFTLSLKNANLLIYWFLPRQDRDEVLGDLEEGYYRVLKLSGSSWARRWYWWQTIRSVGYFLVCKIATVFKEIRQFGIKK